MPPRKSSAPLDESLNENDGDETLPCETSCERRVKESQAGLDEGGGESASEEGRERGGLSAPSGRPARC